MRIKVHPALCDGHRECRRIGGKLFPLDADGHLELRLAQVPPELEYTVVLAAATCPTDATSVISQDDDHYG